MNRGIFGVFGVLCASAFHLKKLDCRGIVILLEGGSQIILTGLAAHTEQAGQQRYNEDTTQNPQGNGARASRAVSGQRGFCCPASTSGCNFEPYKRFSGSCDMMLFTYECEYRRPSTRAICCLDRNAVGSNIECPAYQVSSQLRSRRNAVDCAKEEPKSIERSYQWT